MQDGTKFFGRDYCLVRAPMMDTEIAQTLRRRIIADLHLGRLKPGDRLPSLRTISKRLGVSIRAAARAYAELQTEGLVAVRGRSGIYLVMADPQEPDLEAPLDWYAEMLRGAWSRRLTIQEVTALLQQIVANPMTVACIESTEDHMAAFCSELAADFAVKTVSVTLTGATARVDETEMTLYDALSLADIAVTTAFHASEVRAAAELLQKPVIIVSVNDVLVDAVARQLESGPVTIVAQDPAFVERFNQSLLECFEQNGELHVITLGESMADPAATAGTTTLFTRAARKYLNEDEYHLLPPPISFISDHAAKRLVHAMLTLHRQRVLQPV